MGCADVFLLPSEFESFGLVALEAMSCEVPVVATNVGGIPEVVKHGETGFLGELGNVKQMAEQALTILKNPDLKAKMAAAGRRRAVELFDQRNIVPLYENYYERILGKCGKLKAGSRGCGKFGGPAFEYLFSQGRAAAPHHRAAPAFAQLIMSKTKVPSVP